MISDDDDDEGEGEGEGGEGDEGGACDMVMKRAVSDKATVYIPCSGDALVGLVSGMARMCVVWGREWIRVWPACWLAGLLACSLADGRAGSVMNE